MFTFGDPESSGFMDLLSKPKSNTPRIWFAGVFVVTLVLQLLIYYFVTASGEVENMVEQNPRINFAFMGVSFLVSRYVVMRRFGKMLKQLE